MEYTPNVSKDSMIFNGCEGYMVVEKEIFQIYFTGDMLIFCNVHYVPSMGLNLPIN